MTVVLDPGHGGRDPGAVGIGGLKEAEVNLLLAHMVKARLEPFYRILMTRMEDRTVSLAARCNLANVEGAALFVSLHCNAAANVLARGAETYYVSLSAKPLAEAIQKGLVKLGQRDRKAKKNRFYVLRNTKMPAVLVEAAFITNPEDAALLASVDFLNRAADVIAKAIREHMREG
ncbi:MAG: N-acetylmuramoyl-L-alanine amidase family protein [Bacteroidota bacterium]